MKIKYKLAIAFSLLILIIAVPLAVILPLHQEREIHTIVQYHGALYSNLLSRLTLSTLLANAADVAATKVDVAELLSSFEFLSSYGLIYADCVLLSNNHALNGIILSNKTYGKWADELCIKKVKLDSDEIIELKKTSIKKTTLEKIEGPVYIFSSIAHLSHESNACAARLFFSENIMFASTKALRKASYFFIIIAMVLSATVALLFSRIISRPIEKLTEGLRATEIEGSYKPLEVHSKDEIGHLATTFNHMLRMLDLHIKGLIENNRELRRIDALKNEFLTNTSRELIVPLNNILQMANSLAGTLTAYPHNDARQNLSLIIANAQRLSSLVSAMLDFSQLKNKDISLDFSAIDVHSAAEAVISAMRPHIQKKGLFAKNNIPPGKFIAEADEARLNRILINLISNAVKYTERGHIEISASETNGNMICISITDTGVGIPPEKISTIFEPFAKSNGLFTIAHEGIGLGLPIVKKLVELHGGKIEVCSTQGVGSTFTFTLRKATSETPPSLQLLIPPQELETQIDYPTFNSNGNIAPFDSIILIVDDDHLHLHALKSLLESHGYTAIACTNGIDALRAIENQPNISLIILDVMMPQISGYDIARTVRKQYQAHELPIIMLTTRGYPEDIVAGFEAGANDYLIKPIHIPELLARVKSLIGLRNAVLEHRELSILKHDVSIAHSIQNSLLPNSLPQVKGISVAVRYIPMTDLGGDLYDFSIQHDGAFEIFIADASGHGISAALISTMTSISYRFSTTIQRTLPEKLSSINKAMCAYEHGQFITACLVHISPDRRTLTYSNAGHWPFIVLRNAQSDVELHRDEGVPLGWLADAGYVENRIPLTMGDRIVLFTDGIIECKNEKEEIFGIKRFTTLVKDFQTTNAEQCANLIIEEIKRWSGKTSSFDDDLTLIVIDIVG
ncbi:MAG: SpoIIE family protein phosphatase [Spirochaetes bacterium]|nr:SpoIIE family protein phosphatase [Spirochaetota bacterium]